MRFITSVWSAICGIHLGETNAVASTAGSPAPASRSMSSTFTSVETCPGSFCSPSRGPTSTIFTASSKGDQLRAFEHLLARAVVDFLHHAVGGRDDCVLHLHRLEYQERLAARHLRAGGGQYLDDPAGHGCGKRAVARLVAGSGEFLLERKPPIVALAEDVPVVAFGNRARLEYAAIEANEQAAVFQPLAGELAGAAIHHDAQP